jgi:hypothetical protein
MSLSFFTKERLISSVGRERANELWNKKKTLSKEEWLGELAKALVSRERLEDSGSTEAARITTTVMSIR